MNEFKPAPQSQHLHLPHRFRLIVCSRQLAIPQASPHVIITICLAAIKSHSLQHLQCFYSHLLIALPGNLALLDLDTERTAHSAFHHTTEVPFTVVLEEIRSI